MIKFINEKLMGDYYPLVTMGVGVFILSWLFFLGDLVMGN